MVAEASVPQSDFQSPSGRIMVVFLLCVFGGSVLGYSAALGIEIGYFGLPHIIGVVVGACIGLLLSPFVFFSRSRPNVLWDICFSLLIVLPVARFSAFYFGPIWSAVITAIMILFSFFIVGLMKIKENFKKILVLTLAPLSIGSSAALVYWANKLPDEENALIQMMGNNDMQLSFEAVHKLMKKGKCPFLRACVNENPNIRAVAVHSLSKFPDKDVQNVLLTATNDSNSYVRMWSAFSLGEIGDKDVVPTLEKLSVDRERNVREYAFEALKKITKK